MSFDSLIAVVMPVYHQEKFVGKAIQSVLAQGYRNWFLSICDDGSTDRSREIVAAYARHVAAAREPGADSAPDGDAEGAPPGRIVAAYHTGNLGLPAARNTAYAAIPLDAEFVIFLDSDDLLAPDAMETQLRRFAVASRAGIVCGDKADIGACGCPVTPKYYTPPLTPGRIYRFEDWLNADLGVFPPSRLMFRRWVTDSAGGWNIGLNAVEDHDFYLRCALAGATLVYEPGVVTRYRNHAGNRTDDRAGMQAAWPLRQRLMESYRRARLGRGK